MTRGAVLLLLSLLACRAGALEFETAEIRTRLTYGHATAGGSTIETGIALGPALELGLGDSAALKLSARVRWDGSHRLSPGAPDTRTYSRPSRPWIIGGKGVAELRDAYLELRLGRGLLRLGKQQIAWGALDGLKILDAVNPQSFREFILDDFAESRIALWSAYADLSVGGWRAELAWIPDATGHEIPVEGAWFELRAPRFRFGSPPDVPRPPTTTREPGFGWHDAAAGLRLSRSAGSWDLGLVALSGTDPEPLGRSLSSASGPVLERFYERRELYGASAATSYGRIALRAELAVRPDRRFNSRAGGRLEVVAHDQLSAGLGLDVAGPFDIFINLQYLVDHVRSAPPGLVRPATDRLATVLLRRSFAYEAVMAELRWYGDVDRGDGLVRAAVARTLGNDTVMRLELDLFYGAADGLFGQFAERDRVTLSVEHVF